MLKHIFGLLVIAVSISSYAQTTIHGTLMAYDGSSLKAGRVIVSQLNTSYDEIMVTVDDYGNFDVEPDFSGPYLLKAFGVHHKNLYLPIFSDLTELRLDIKLGTFDYFENGDISAIGDFNDYAILDEGRWIALDKQGSTYTGLIEKVQNPFNYQLVKVIKGGAISGFGTSYEIYDANYLSDGYATISDSSMVSFDLGWLPPQGKEAEIVSNDLGLSAVAKAYAHILTLQRVMRTRDFTESISDVEERLSNASSASEYAALLINYLAIDAVKKQVFFRTPQPNYFKGDLNPEIVKEILSKIDPSSNIWLMRFNAPGALPTAMPAASLEGMAPKEHELLTNYLEEMVKSNPNESVRAYALLGLARWAKLQGDEVGFNDYYARLSSYYKNAFAYADAQREFSLPNELQSNDSIPNFEFVSLIESHNSYKKESLQAKLTLIDFWSISCGPCIQQMPDLEKLYEDYKDKGFDIISVSMDKDPQEAKRFSESNFNMSWRHGYIPFAFKSQLAIDLEVYGLPKLIFVDQNGIVRRTVEGTTNFRFLEKIVQEELRR